MLLVKEAIENLVRGQGGYLRRLYLQEALHILYLLAIVLLEKIMEKIVLDFL